MSAARNAPRYTGVRTFAGLAQAQVLGASATDEAERRGDERARGREQQPPRADVALSAAIVGAPFDTATSWRPGARFGPEAIRAASVLLRPWHALHAVEVLGGHVADAGDIPLTPGNAARTAEQIHAALDPLCSAGVTPLVLGGDHSVALGELRAHAAHASEPLGLLLFDAHADTWNDYYGERLFHGTVMRRAAEERLIDPHRSLIAGLHGSLYAAADLDDARELGFELVAIDELRTCAPAAFAARAAERLGGGPAVLSFDIDVIDPSAAPGTGTPEVGGLSAAQTLALLRALEGMRFAGYDLVEVSPPYDSPGQITALLAANIAYEMLALDALARVHG